MDDPEQSWIEQLNRRARHYRVAGMDSYGAVAQAAADFKLSVLIGTGMGKACSTLSKWELRAGRSREQKYGQLIKRIIERSKS